jgi:hypothetical protein
VKQTEMPRIAVFLPPAEHERLQDLARAQARSVSRQAQTIILEALRTPPDPEQSSAA